MNKFFKRLSLVLALVMLISMQSSLVFAADNESKAETQSLKGQIVILHTNDSHSRADAELGYASVKGWKDFYETQGASVMVLDAGDSLHGLPIANLGQGENIVDIMNAAGYTAMTPGNHDFNYGSKRLLELKKDMKFDLLSANLTDDSGNLLLTPSKLYEINGKKIGLVGISTPETATKTDAKNVVGCSFNEKTMVAMVQTQIDKLEKEGAEYIVALGHLGIEKSSIPYCSTDMIKGTDGIDVFVDGHSHTPLEKGQLVEDKSGNQVVLAQAANYMEAIGKVTISDDGKITAGLIKEAKVDTAVQKLITDRKAEIQPMLDTVVAKTDVALDGERAPGVRTQETNMGDLAADAIRYAANADVALTNGGGIRVSLKEGNITYGDLNSVFPFGNTVVSAKITGKDLLAALESGTKTCPEASGAFPQVSGMSFELHTALSENRVQNVKVGNEPLNLEKIYTLALNDFNKSGGDGYTMLAACEKIGEFGALDEALVNYIEKGLKGTVGKEYEKSQGRINIISTESASVQFEDMTKHWAKTSVAKVVQAGLFNGTSETKFSPNQPMTRGMFVTALGRAAKADVSTIKESSFSDVSIDSWYGKYVVWAAVNGIATGNGKGEFAPNETITREQMAVMMLNYCKYMKEGPVGSWAIMLDYTDLDKLSDWSGEGVMFCTLKGYMSGYPDSTFRPQGTATRAEVATILDRFMSRT